MAAIHEVKITGSGTQSTATSEGCWELAGEIRDEWSALLVSIIDMVQVYTGDDAPWEFPEDPDRQAAWAVVLGEIHELAKDSVGSKT